MPTGQASVTAAKKKVADLERVRNNQRRCRARQKEYIAELEDKIGQYESASSQSVSDLKLQQLVKENESLKRLLQSLGLGGDFLRAYSKASQIAPDIARTQLDNESCCQANDCPSSTPSLDSVQLDLIQNTTREIQAQNVSLFSTANAEDSIQESLQFLDSLTQLNVGLPWEPFDFPIVSTSALGLSQTEIQTDTLVHSTADSLGTETSRNMIPTEDISDTTTLCSLAFSLVLKNNTRRYSAADLNFKLQVGYRSGIDPSEGCRVDNKVLVNVLMEIS